MLRIPSLGEEEAVGGRGWYGSKERCRVGESIDLPYPVAVLGKNIGGGPGPSSFGRQPRLSEITIEAISGVLPKFRWVYARNVAPSIASAER